jgi:hypothetical protein
VQAKLVVNLGQAQAGQCDVHLDLRIVAGLRNQALVIPHRAFQQLLPQWLEARFLQDRVLADVAEKLMPRVASLFEPLLRQLLGLRGAKRLPSCQSCADN